MIQAFITVPKKSLDIETEPSFMSQCLVLYCSSSILIRVCHFTAEAGLGITPARSTCLRISSPLNTLEMYHAPWQDMLQTK